MSHEHDHDHDHHAAPKQSSRPGPARGRAGTGQPALSPQEEQFEQALFAHQARHLLREAHQRAAARAGASTDAAGPNAPDTAHSAHATHVGPARDGSGTGPPALSTPPSSQALLLHQARHLLREAHQRAAAKAGASTDAAQLGQAGHAVHGGHAAPAEAGVTQAASAAGQPDDHFYQVQEDLTYGNFVGALSLLDYYWPASAGMAHDRALVAGRIVASLHAALVPLKMDRMLYTLQQVQTRLDEVLTGGHRLRDLLLAAAHGLDRDRLTFALTLLDKDKGLNYLEDRQGRQDASLPHYLIDHFDDFTGALAYFQRMHQPVGAGAHAPLQSIGAYVGSNSGVLWGALGDFAAAAAAGVQQAVDAIGDSPADYTVTAEAFVGALLPAAAVLAPETFGTSAIIAATLFGAAVTAASTQVSPQETFKAVVLTLMGQPTGALADSFCDTVLNKAEWIVSQVYRSAQQQKWTQNRLELVGQPAINAAFAGARSRSVGRQSIPGLFEA